jgi:hypothetical protein
VLMSPAQLVCSSYLLISSAHSSHLRISSAHLVCPARMSLSSAHIVCPARMFLSSAHLAEGPLVAPRGMSSTNNIKSVGPPKTPLQSVDSETSRWRGAPKTGGVFRSTIWDYV